MPTRLKVTLYLGTLDDLMSGKPGGTQCYKAVKS